MSSIGSSTFNLLPAKDAGIGSFLFGGRLNGERPHCHVGCVFRQTNQFTAHQRQLRQVYCCAAESFMLHHRGIESNQVYFFDSTVVVKYHM